MSRVSLFIGWCRTCTHQDKLKYRLWLYMKVIDHTPEHLSSPPVFSGVRINWSLVLCVCFVDRFLSFFFWPLCCLFFFFWPLCCLSFFFWPLCCLSFDLRVLITLLVSSNSFYQYLLNFSNMHFQSWWHPVLEGTCFQRQRSHSGLMW